VGRQSRDSVKGARKRRERRMAQLQMIERAMIERAQAENPSVAPSAKISPPDRATRRRMIRAIVRRFGAAKAPAMCFPQGLPPVNVLGPCTNVVFRKPPPRWVKAG
jgi:hypothetical protein